MKKTNLYIGIVYLFTSNLLALLFVLLNKSLEPKDFTTGCIYYSIIFLFPLAGITIFLEEMSDKLIGITFLFITSMVFWGAYAFFGIELWNSHLKYKWEPLIFSLITTVSFLIMRFLLVHQIISFIKYFRKILNNRDVIKAIVAFIIVYFGIILFFSMIYAIIYRIYGLQSFKTEIPNLNFLHFFYFSVVTSTTLGYGDITPKSPVAITTCIIEVIVSVILVGLYLGAVISSLSNSKSSKEQNQ
jgi:hypothetical protein